MNEIRVGQRCVCTCIPGKPVVFTCFVLLLFETEALVAQTGLNLPRQLKKTFSFDHLSPTPKDARYASLSDLCATGYSNRALCALSKHCTDRDRFPVSTLVFYYGEGVLHVSHSKGRRQESMCFLQQDAKVRLVLEKN